MQVTQSNAIAYNNSHLVRERDWIPETRRRQSGGVTLLLPSVNRNRIWTKCDDALIELPNGSGFSSASGSGGLEFWEFADVPLISDCRSTCIAALGFQRPGPIWITWRSLVPITVAYLPPFSETKSRTVSAMKMQRWMERIPPCHQVRKSFLAMWYNPRLH